MAKRNPLLIQSSYSDHTFCRLCLKTLYKSRCKIRLECYESNANIQPFPRRVIRTQRWFFPIQKIKWLLHRLYGTQHRLKFVPITIGHEMDVQIQLLPSCCGLQSFSPLIPSIEKIVSVIVPDIAWHVL